MISYHVFFTPKPGIGDEQAIGAVRRFLENLKAGKQVRDYRILHVTNPASFPALPRFQVIVDYDSQRELDEAMAFMRQPHKVMEGPHGELVALVSEFKVSFTADV